MKLPKPRGPTSTTLVDALRRPPTRFFDEHVEADAVQEQVAAVDLCGGYVAGEADQKAAAADVLFGAACLSGGRRRRCRPHGRRVARRARARRGTVALCRCGKSAIKPFCDGSRKLVGFRAPAAGTDRL